MPRFVAVVFLACSALGAQAQEAATEAAPEPRDDGLGFFSGDYELAEPEGYSVKFEPFVWYVSPGGDVGFGGDTPLVDTSDLSLDNPWVSGGAELHLGKDKWRLSLLGAHSQQNGDSVANSALMLNTLPVAAGDTIHAEFDMTVASVRAGYEVWSFAAEPNNEGIPRISSALEVVGGLRAFDYSLESEINGGGPGMRVKGDMFHVEPIVGMKWEIEFERKFAIDFSSNFGYLPKLDDQSSSSLDLTAGFRYRPTPNLGVQIGYRLLVFDLEDDDVEAEGALAGLYGGISIRF